MLGVAPVLGALEWTGVDLERAARAVARLEPGAQGYAPRFFTAAEWRTVNVLVDYVIPRDERSGSATDAKVPEFMDFMLSDPETATSEASKTGMRSGLAWLDAESGRRFSRTFVDATDSQRRSVLDDIAWPSRAPAAMREGVTFFNRFRDMTAAGFFSSQIGWQDLEYIGHTFVPQWNGCPEPAMRKLGVSHDLMSTRVPVQYGRDEK
ncbi:MAG TPA: gluconate 2-dehydrogenase subunit 3 family protein [Gemmatimonadaceae bacterium]|nr:gluconate 2-dehydrogenase subunit 3 family protein [Gemmatimonadaceae bacterium]